MIEGDDVMHALLLPVAPEEAFEMFVDPARLVRWIGLSADLDPRPGGLRGRCPCDRRRAKRQREYSRSDRLSRGASRYCPQEITMVSA